MQATPLPHRLLAQTRRLVTVEAMSACIPLINNSMNLKRDGIMQFISAPELELSLGFMMFFLCGFPAGSLQKILLRDVVLMRVPIGFLQESLAS